MKIAEKIINNLEFKKKKNSSLISSIEKIKYHDLIAISPIIDNHNFLTEYSLGWNSIHYSVLNENVEVLFFLCNLHQKHNIPLNSTIKTLKNGCVEDSNSLDVAIFNQKLNHFIVLNHFGLTQHMPLSHFIIRNKNNYGEINFEEEYKKYNLPFENSIINLFLLNYSYEGLKLLENNNIYDEKQSYIDCFLKNHEHLCKSYLNTYFFDSYSRFFDKLKESENLSINKFDFFMNYLIEGYKQKNVDKDLDYKYISYFTEKTLTDNFIDELNNSKLKDDLIHIFKNMNNELYHKNINKFYQMFDIDKILLNEKLNSKIINSKNERGHKI